MRTTFLITIISLILYNCSSNNKQIGDIQIMDATLKQDLQTISKAKIFFGHQSVGYNIMDGLNKLSQKAKAGIHIVDLKESSSLPDTYFAHALNGINEQPKTKCDAFVQTLSGEFADSLNIAFFKFCYIDFNRDTDINELFNYYKKTMECVHTEHPSLKLIYVTAPLRLVQSGWKAKIKRILGKELGGAAENIKRNQFNDLIRKEFPKEKIFDLAKTESTYPDGHRERFEKDGKKYYAMVPQYTTDGGHLNTFGGEWAAKELIHVIAKMLNGTR